MTCGTVKRTKSKQEKFIVKKTRCRNGFDQHFLRAINHQEYCYSSVVLIKKANLLKANENTCLIGVYLFIVELIEGEWIQSLERCKAVTVESGRYAYKNLGSCG